MTEDLVPALIEQVKAEFLARIQRDSELAAKLTAITGGSVSYTDALDYADCIGRALSEALSAVLTGDALPDGTLYYNIAKRLLEDMGGNAYDLAAQAAEQVQAAINSAAGIGLKPISPGTKSERLTDLINTVSGHPVDEVSSKLLAGARALPQGAVSDTMEANAEFQGKAGLKAKIVRRDERGCCKWCSSVAGSYSYPDVPKDVYRRHDNCRCKVEYIPSKGEWQTVHSGQEGRRRYVQDKYGNYELSKEARVAHAKEMEATEAERKAAAREKRIATWAKKKQSGS